MTRKQVWMIVGLVGSYVICQAVADVGATKMVSLGGIVMPGGTFIFALTFTLRDVIHKRLGREWARAAIVLAGAFNVLQAGYLWMVARLSAPVFFINGEAWSAIFSIVPAITIGSIVAELVSELVDTEVYHGLTRLKIPQWLRVLGSNLVSLPLDSLLFGSLAFVVLPGLFGAQASPFGVAMQAVGGQIVWKAAVTVISLPMIYAVKEKTVFKP